MKQLLILMLFVGLASGASAQHHRAVWGGHTTVRSHAGIGIGAYAPHGLYNRAFGNSPYSRYGFPYNSYTTSRPSKLDLQVQDIRNDYKDRRWSAKQDHSLSRQQRKEWIRTLKYEEEKAVQEARRSYYKSR